MKHEPIRCAGCGQFIPYADLGEDGPASSTFVPDSHFTHEETLFHCRRCTKRYGGPNSTQPGARRYGDVA